MRNKRITIGANLIEKAVEELREQDRMDEGSVNFIQRRLGRLEGMVRSSFQYTIVLAIPLGVGFSVFFFCSQTLRILPDTLPQEAATTIYILGLLVAAALLFGFSSLLMKLIFYLPKRRSIGKLGQAVLMHQQLRTLFRENFRMTPEEAIDRAKL